MCVHSWPKPNTVSHVALLTTMKLGGKDKFLSFLSSMSKPDVASQLKLGTCYTQLLLFPSCPVSPGTTQMPGGHSRCNPTLMLAMSLCVHFCHRPTLHLKSWFHRICPATPCLLRPFLFFNKLTQLTKKLPGWNPMPALSWGALRLICIFPHWGNSSWKGMNCTSFTSWP